MKCLRTSPLLSSSGAVSDDYGIIEAMTNRRCWHCDVVSHMTVQGSPSLIASEQHGWLLQATFSCDQCKYLQIGEGLRRKTGNTGWDHNVGGWFAGRADGELTWYPAVGVSPPFLDVPDHIAEAASEAHRCWSIQAFRGATALARAVIEASAKEKGITKGQLFEKIEKLEAAGHIRSHIREAAHEVRHLGNEVAHGDFVETIESEEAEEVLALMAEVLQEVFQSPARVARVKAAREAKKGSKAAQE